eukprot:2861485-Rhodomonas_salina.1
MCESNAHHTYATQASTVVETYVFEVLVGHALELLAVDEVVLEALPHLSHVERPQASMQVDQQHLQPAIHAVAVERVETAADARGRVWP